jgi:MFS family permease
VASRHIPRSQSWHSSAHGNWHLSPDSRIHYSIIFQPNLASLPHPRHSRRFRRRLHLHPLIAILSQLFHHRRSLANGISSAGSGIGGLLFAFLIRGAITNLSLAWALRITALVSGVMNIAATIAIRSRNYIIMPKQHPFDRKLLRRYDVLLVLGWAFISMLGYITLLFSTSAFATSICLNSTRATTVTALLNLGTAIGRPFIGSLVISLDASRLPVS